MIFYYPKIIEAKIARASGKTGGITQLLDGDLTFSTGSYAIFVIFQADKIPWYVHNAVAALSKSETNLLVVSNAPLTPNALAYLTPLCHKIIIRDNSGFDLGGYRDAVLYAIDNLPDLKRLTFINDSVFFLEDGLADFIQRLTRSTDCVCAAFENWERKYHFQSFALSVSGDIFRSDVFRRFWKNYLPVSARRYAINAGEIGFTKAIKPITKSIEIIYSPNALRPYLSKLPPGELQTINSYLPIWQRIPVDDYDYTLPASARIDEIVRRVAIRSQVHTGGFQYRRFLNWPLVKRDLLYRLEFSLYDVEQCLLDNTPAGELQNILSEMRQKGRGTDLPLIKKLLFMDGTIGV